MNKQAMHRRQRTCGYITARLLIAAAVVGLMPIGALLAKDTDIAPFRTAAAEYSIQLAKTGKPLTLQEKPVFRWTNPQRGDQAGAVFVWTQNARPEVIGCCFNYSYRGQARTKHQLHSLATTPLSARVDGQAVWEPSKPGLVFQPIPNAGRPAATDAKRNFQIRKLARRFKIEVVDDDNNETTQLRLLPTPLTTYKPPTGASKFGALFSFAKGTDPDAILVIENRQQQHPKIQNHDGTGRSLVFTTTGCPQPWTAKLSGPSPQSSG